MSSVDHSWGPTGPDHLSGCLEAQHREQHRDLYPFSPHPQPPSPGALPQSPALSQPARPGRRPPPTPPPALIRGKPTEFKGHEEQPTWTGDRSRTTLPRIPGASQKGNVVSARRGSAPPAAAETAREQEGGEGWGERITSGEEGCVRGARGESGAGGEDGMYFAFCKNHSRHYHGPVLGSGLQLQPIPPKPCVFQKLRSKPVDSPLELDLSALCLGKGVTCFLLVNFSKNLCI